MGTDNDSVSYDHSINFTWTGMKKDCKEKFKRFEKCQILKTINKKKIWFVSGEERRNHKVV